MLTLSPPFFPSIGWPLEDPISQEHNSFYRDISSDSLLPSPQSSSRPQAGGDINGSVKKLNHNASERNRRKKINNLYSSLFSLLPAADRMKKLSFPATVSCVVKYIPELQKEVERLVQKKEELSSGISRQQEDVVVLHHLEEPRKMATGRSLSGITVNAVWAKEVVIHISSLKANKSLLSETVHNLEEEDGLFLLNASSFESLGEKVFHNLHFQVQGNYKVDLEIIRRKVLSLYEKSEEMPF